MKITFINVTNVIELNLGLAYVISSVENAGHEAALIDLAFAPSNYKHRWVINKLRKQKPDIIGFSTMTCSYQESLQLAKKIKEEFSDIPLIWGGTHATILPEETLSNPLVDAICIGEGEEALPEYLNKLEKGEKPYVKGIWYKENGKIIKTPLRPFIQNLDKLPFPNWNYWNIKEYLKLFGSLPLLASRGCPYNCSFCSTKVLSTRNIGAYFRLRTARNVIEEIKANIEKYRKFGLTTIIFQDPSFGIDKKQFNEFVSLYKKEKLDIFWTCTTRADIITKEWAKKAKISNCIMVELGLETGNEKRRIKIYNKVGLTNNKFKACVKWLKRYDIPFLFFLLIGTPGENGRDIFESIKFAETLEPNIICLGIYEPLPGTQLGEFCFSHGLINLNFNYDGLPRVETENLCVEELDKIYLKLRIRGMKRVFLKNFTYFFTPPSLKKLVSDLLNRYKVKIIYQKDILSHRLFVNALATYFKYKR